MKNILINYKGLSEERDESPMVHLSKNNIFIFHICHFKVTNDKSIFKLEEDYF